MAGIADRKALPRTRVHRW